MKGYELLKEIAEGNIKEGTEIFVKTNDDMKFGVCRLEYTNERLEHIEGREIGTHEFCSNKYNFEIIQDERDKIEEIKKRLKNTPKSCLNEKYAEDIKYLIELYENKNKDYMKLQAFYSGDYVRKSNIENQIEELRKKCLSCSIKNILPNECDNLCVYKVAIKELGKLLIE